MEKNWKPRNVVSHGIQKIYQAEYIIAEQISKAAKK